MATAAVHKKNAIFYINRINTSKKESFQHIKQIKQSLSPIVKNIYYAYIYNPPTIDLSSNAKNLKSFPVEKAIKSVIEAAKKSNRVFLVTHSNGATQAEKILHGLVHNPKINDQVLKKLEVLNFGPDRSIEGPPSIKIQNFLFNKDRISIFSQILNSQSINQVNLQDIIWLNDPPKIPKKQLPKSADIPSKVFRNIQYALDNAENRHQFKSYFPYIIRALVQKVT